jgi:FKBP-type peptidyl-prolyl cis-trans isomerase SlpA
VDPSRRVEITPGYRVRVHFALTLPDGTEAISTFGDAPIDFVMGDGTLLPTLELALYGLRAGDEQTLTLRPEQAFGLHDPALVHELLRGDFPDGLAPEVGQIVAFATPDGDETAGAVVAVGDRVVRVDFNHPLAGHDVVFRVEVLEVESAP